MLTRAVELAPRDGMIIDSLGWAYYRMGRYDEAVRELEKAVELKAGDPVINDHLGDAYWRVGRKLEAKFQWNHAKDSNPEHEDLVKHPEEDRQRSRGCEARRRRERARRLRRSRTRNGGYPTTRHSGARAKAASSEPIPRLDLLAAPGVFAGCARLWTWARSRPWNDILMSCPPSPRALPAKINLTLHVLGRRADGYHELESLVAFAGTGDDACGWTPARAGLDCRRSDRVGCGRETDNLVLKAARLLAERIPGLKVGTFHLTKRLPVAAGIGGGSSDAAAASATAGAPQRSAAVHPAIIEAARLTGADVPVCLEPRARMMRGVGDVLGPTLRPAAPFGGAGQSRRPGRDACGVSGAWLCSTGQNHSGVAASGRSPRRALSRRWSNRCAARNDLEAPAIASCSRSSAMCLHLSQPRRAAGWRGCRVRARPCSVSTRTMNWQAPPRGRFATCTMDGGCKRQACGRRAVTGASGTRNLSTWTQSRPE